MPDALVVVVDALESTVRAFGKLDQVLAQVDPDEATSTGGTELVRSVRDGLAAHADPAMARLIRARHHEQVGLPPPEDLDRGQRPDLGQRAAADLTAESVRCIERPLLLVLVLVEHGLAPDARTRRWQHGLTPIWRRLGGGCRLDRDVSAILRDAGYHLVELTADYSAGVRWLSFTSQGIARPA